MQASQSELDLEKFAASILLEDGPLPAGEALGHARTSDSSLQGSNSGWEAMLVDNLPSSMPEQGTAFGTAPLFEESCKCRLPLTCLSVDVVPILMISATNDHQLSL